MRAPQAETNGGGLALWGSDGRLGQIRTGDETYHQAWLPWITQIGRLIAANQITEGGVRPCPPPPFSFRSSAAFRPQGRRTTPYL